MSPKQRQHFPFGCIAQAWTVCVQFPAYIFNPKMQTSHFINLTVSLMSGLARLSFCVHIVLALGFLRATRYRTTDFCIDVCVWVADYVHSYPLITLLVVHSLPMGILRLDITCVFYAAILFSCTPSSGNPLTCSCRYLPLMVLSVAPSPTHPVMPYPLIWAAILILIVGATTGYFGTIPMVLAPKLVDSEHREIAGKNHSIQIQKYYNVNAK